MNLATDSQRNANEYSHYYMKLCNEAFHENILHHEVRSNHVNTYAMAGKCSTCGHI
jgi:hypothetical protein